MIYEQLYPSVTSVMSDMPKSQSEGSALEKLVQRRMDLCEKLTELLTEIGTRLDDIMDMINTLPDNEQIVIIYRYIKGMRWEAISRKTNYSERHMRRVRDRAIEAMSIVKNKDVRLCP